LPDIAPFGSDFAHAIYAKRYQHPQDRDWHGTAARVAAHPMLALQLRTGANLIDHTARIAGLIGNRQFLPGGRYLYATGRDLHQVNNCVLLRCGDSREGWAELSYNAEMALMTGAGIGVWYGDVRPSGEPIRRTGGIASGPLPKMQQINETGRHTLQGGNRRSAIWAGLPWYHRDVFEFITVKDWPEEIKVLKAKDWNFPAACDMTNISVCLDDAFFLFHKGLASVGHQFLHEQAPDWMRDDHGKVPFHAPDGGTWRRWAQMVYDEAVRHMCLHGEPGFSVDTGDKWREKLRNACTEITSEDDSDICNLGSLNMAAFDSLEDFAEATALGTMFLLAGTVYSDLPHEEVYATREKNRRLGLGVMGVHEWLLKRGKPYAPDDELGTWLAVYEMVSDNAAEVWAERFGVSVPVKKRAIAPNGTIGIVAETTTSGEPILAAAYKRRVVAASANGDRHEFEYVVDPTAARLIAQGVDPELIEDAYTLAYDVERRFAFQAWLQQFVDHGISSTINLPRVEQQNFTPQEFGEMLLPYLPKMRGLTCYPDGCRGGQPITAVPVEYAMDKVGVRFEENEDRCVGGACGV